MRSKFKWIFTLLVALTMQLSFAQDKTVTGKVTDKSGALPGANVVVRGTKRSASTDFDGSYSIKAKQNDVLVFSFVGKTDKSVTVGASSSYNVQLGDGESLETVVVNGAYGLKRSKNSATSSIQTISSKELTQAGNPSIIQSLTGKVSGLQINTTGYGVNSTSRIVLRGLRTITGNAEALVVIDNSISTAAILAQLPPEIIDNVTIIKGQQGSALYGEQGSNGVIVVSTKKGTKSQKPVISINSSVDFENINALPQRQTSYGQGWYSDPSFGSPTVPAGTTTHVTFENGSWGANFNDPRYLGVLTATGLPQADGKLLLLPYVGNQDNIKKFFKTGTLFQTGASINMGGEDGYALISVNRRNTDFVVDGDKLNNTSFLFKGGKKIGKATIGGSVNYALQNVTQSDPGLFNDLLNAATNIPVELFSSGVNGNHWTVYNKSPYWKEQHMRYDDRRTVLNASVNLGYDFTKNIGVTYNLNLGNVNTISEYHNDGDTQNVFYNTQAGYTYGGSPITDYFSAGGTTIPSQYFISNILNRSINSDLLVNFNYQLTDNIGFKANIGNTLQETTFKIDTNGGTGLNIPGLYNTSNVANLNSVNLLAISNVAYTPYKFFDQNNGNKLDNRSTLLRKVAFFANTDFNYKDYLFLNATARYEQTSVVSGTQFYPSVGLSFIPTLAIDGLKNSKVLNYAKLNVNYSVTGNTTAVRANDTYGVVGAYGPGYPFNSQASFGYPGNLTDKNIKGEFVYTAEAGLALGFFKDRVTFSGTVFKSDTKDLITNRTASSASGPTSVRGNIGSLQNTGYEIDFGLTPIKTNSFRWDIKSNISVFKTIVTSLAEGATEIVLNTSTGAGVYAVLGDDFPLIKGTTYQRDPNGNVIVGATGTPLLNAGLQKIGKVNPDYILGITNSFEYKGLKLTAVVDYRAGGVIYSQTKRDLTFTGALIDSGNFDRNVGYVYPGSVQLVAGAYVPNTTPAGGGGYTATGNYFSSVALNVGEHNVIDATAFKVRELSLSYSLPSKMIESVGLSSFRFGINARNLFVLYGNPFKGKSSYQNQGYTDPESSNTTATQRNANGTGISDQSQYPSSRTLGFSINLTF